MQIAKGLGVSIFIVGHVTKDGNIVRGDKAISDFNTSKSRLVAKKGGRISGKLIEK